MNQVLLYCVYWHKQADPHPPQHWKHQLGSISSWSVFLGWESLNILWAWLAPTLPAWLKLTFLTSSSSLCLLTKGQICILHLSACLPTLQTLKVFSFPRLPWRGLSFSLSLSQYKRPCSAPRWVPLMNLTLLKVMFICLSWVCILWEGAAVKRKWQISPPVWLSGVIWYGLGFQFMAQLPLLLTWPHAWRHFWRSQSHKHLGQTYMLSNYPVSSRCGQAVRAHLQASGLSLLCSSGWACERRDSLLQRQLQRCVCRRTVSGKWIYCASVWDVCFRCLSTKSWQSPDPDF